MNTIDRIKLALGFGMVTAILMLPPLDAQALDCGAINAPDEEIRTALNSARDEGGMPIFPIVENVGMNKTLIVHQVDWLGSAGCRVTMSLGLTLERKLRADAHGYAMVSGIAATTGNQVCIYDVHVDTVKVSSTTVLGESFYRLVANLRMPDVICSE